MRLLVYRASCPQSWKYFVIPTQFHVWILIGYLASGKECCMGTWQRAAASLEKLEERAPVLPNLVLGAWNRELEARSSMKHPSDLAHT